MRVISASQLIPSAVRPAPAWGRVYSVRFAFARVAVRIQSPMADLISALCKRYDEHLTGAAPDFTFTICETPRGYQFFCAHDGVREWIDGALPSDAVAFLADAAIMAAVVHFDPALSSIHAAAISDGRSGAIIAGDSTAGKTTTLLACAREGLRVFSDERALLRGNVLQPFLRLCSVRNGGKGYLLADCAHDALAGVLRASADVSIRGCFGRSALAAPVAMRAVFVLSGCGDEAAVERMEPVHALPAISRWFDMRGPTLGAMARAVALLQPAACFRLTLGSPASSARAIRHALAQLP